MTTRIVPSLVIALSATALLPGVAAAAGSRAGVTPEAGEMVLLREVSARPAYRPKPPGMALIVDPTPNRELHGALGTGELSDADFAAISSGQGAGTVGPAAVVGRTVDAAMAAGLGTGAVKHDGAVSGGSFGGAVSGPLGTVGATTRGIGAQVTGALSQFPLGHKPPGGP